MSANIAEVTLPTNRRFIDSNNRTPYQIPAGGFIDYTPASNVFSIYIGGYTTSGTGPRVDVIFVPLSDTISASQVRSPLGFVLTSTDAEPRKLVGSFFSSEGIELRQGTFVVQFEMDPEQTPKTLGQLMLATASANTLWADCVEFRGMLYGGPLLVFPGSLQANEDPIGTYEPGANFLRIEPGPLVLGGEARLQQLATGPGYADRPVEPIFLGQTDIPVDTSAEFYVDLTSCVVGAVAVQFAWNTDGGARSQLQIQAF